MAQQAGRPQQTIGDSLARRVEVRRGPAAHRAEALRELGAVDEAVYAAVADTPTAVLDEPVRRLSNAANRSRLWLGIAAAIALLGGRRGRRAALEGVVAIGVTSATVNLGLKPIAHRERPDRLDPDVPTARQRPDAEVELVPVRPRSVRVRVQLRRRQATARPGRPAGPAGGRGRLFASPHRRALSRRRDNRVHSGRRNGNNGGRSRRPSPRSIEAPILTDST